MEPNSKQTLLAALPAVHDLLQHEGVRAFEGRVPRPLVVLAIQKVLEGERARILRQKKPGPVETDQLLTAIGVRLEWELTTGPRPVINATGVILHTNLGRAPLATEAIEAIVEAAAHYSDLEFDLQAGQRGSRHVHTEGMLRELLECEAAFAVNNGAGAVLLALNTVAGAGGRVAVSRGELIEIGGSFRIPDILRASGAQLVEIGTTNRTHLADYEEAIAEGVAAVLKVHPSNYRVVGFHTEVGVQALSEVTRAASIPLIVDLGSGKLSDFQGLEEPRVSQVLHAGAEVVTFSGDKLLGGPQAGIVAGTAAWIDKMRINPLARALRADKLTIAGLAATLRLHLDPSTRARIPVLRMIMDSSEVVHARAERLREALKSRGVVGEIVETEATVGGGSLPGMELPSRAVRLTCPRASALERALRMKQTPVVARVKDDAVLLDARTVFDDQIDRLADAVALAWEECFES